VHSYAGIASPKAFVYQRTRRQYAFMSRLQYKYNCPHYVGLQLITYLQESQIKLGRIVKLLQIEKHNFGMIIIVHHHASMVIGCTKSN